MHRDLIAPGLFVLGILLSVAADYRMRRAEPAPWSNGCIAAAGAALVVAGCAASIG